MTTYKLHSSIQYLHQDMIFGSRRFPSNVFILWSRGLYWSQKLIHADGWFPMAKWNFVERLLRGKSSLPWTQNVSETKSSQCWQPLGSRSPVWRNPVEEFHSEFKTKEASLSKKQILFYYVKSKINVGGRGKVILPIPSKLSWRAVLSRVQGSSNFWMKP